MTKTKIWQTDQRCFTNGPKMFHTYQRCFKLTKTTIDLIANLWFKILGKNVLQDHQSQLVGPNCNQKRTNKWRNQSSSLIQNKQYFWLLWFSLQSHNHWLDKRIKFQTVWHCLLPLGFVLVLSCFFLGGGLLVWLDFVLGWVFWLVFFMLTMK